MTAISESNQNSLTLWGPSPKVLAIDPLKPSFVNLALQLSEKGVNSPQFRWASKMEGALSLLRNESVDCILYLDHPDESNLKNQLIPNIQAIRTSNPVTPVVILSESLPESVWEKVLHYSCEVYITRSFWNSPALFSVINHALRNAYLNREHARFSAERNHQLKSDKEEVEKILTQQRSIISEIERISNESPRTTQSGTSSHLRIPESPNPSDSLTSSEISPELSNRYADLLRSYVVMGPENLSGEISALANGFYEKGLTVRDAFRLHLDQVDLLVSKLGKKSSRKVISGSDLLAMELMMHLCDLYRQ